VTTSEYDEERLGALLRSLPPAPAGLVAAAAELPQMRRDLERIVQLADEDAAFRQALLEDLESALRRAGYEPDRIVVQELRRRFPA
jgi:type VI protein secretion system component VasF